MGGANQDQPHDRPQRLDPHHHGGHVDFPHTINQGEWYRLFSPIVLYIGLIHYFLNMMALWFIRKAVEQCHSFKTVTILFSIPVVDGTILGAIFMRE